MSLANIWRHNIDGRGNSKSKYVEMGACLPDLKGKQGSLCGWSTVKQGEGVGYEDAMVHGTDLSDVSFEPRGDVMFANYTAGCCV